MRIWFPAAPDGTISPLDRALIGMGVAYALDEPAVPIGPVLLTPAPARTTHALSPYTRPAGSALSSYTRPASTVLTVRHEVIT